MPFGVIIIKNYLPFPNYYNLKNQSPHNPQHNQSDHIIAGVDEATQFPMAARAGKEVEGKVTQSPKASQLREFGTNQITQ